MKSVLISIQPKWCELIASGKKTVEVRKTKPKLEPPFKCYIYCTKGKGDCLWRWNGIWYDTQDPKHRPNRLDGKVIGEFVCDVVITAEHGRYVVLNAHDTRIESLDLCDYADGKTVYGWHISDLKIYDHPKKLSEFRAHNVRTYTDEKGYLVPTHEMTRPPQSWCYVEEGGE